MLLTGLGDNSPILQVAYIKGERLFTIGITRYLAIEKWDCFSVYSKVRCTINVKEFKPVHITFLWGLHTRFLARPLPLLDLLCQDNQDYDEFL